MKRHVVLLASSMILCGMVWTASYRFGRASGEAVVQQRLTQLGSANRLEADLPGVSAANQADTPARKPRSRESLTRLLEEWSVGMPPNGASGGAIVRDGMKQLSLEEVRLAMDLVLELPQGLARTKLSMALLSRWADEAPAVALDYLHSHRDDAGAFASLWMSAIFPVWAKHDPKAAARAMAATLQGEEDEIVRGSIGNAIFLVAEKLAETDLTDAMNHVSELPEWGQVSGYRAVARQVDGSGRQRFLDTIRAMPPGSGATAWQQAAAAALAPMDAAAATQWIDSLELAPEARERSSQAVFDQWKQHDPRAATAWAMAQLPGEQHPQLIEQAVAGWALREPNECGRWLNEWGQDPRLDAGFAKFASIISAKDPESARAWAARISDPVQREKILAALGAE